MTRLYLYSLFFAVSVWAQTPITCKVNVATTPIMRGESAKEPVGDILFSCTGIPSTGVLADVKLTLNVPITTPLVERNGVTVSDALLLIDEPTTPVVCPNLFGCGIPTGNSPAPNAFIGTVAGNSITWAAIPIEPPNTTGVSRLFRITNARANANLAAEAHLPVVQGQLTLTPSSNSPIQVPFTVTPNQLVLGNVVNRSFLFQVQPFDAITGSSGQIQDATTGKPPVVVLKVTESSGAAGEGFRIADSWDTPDEPLTGTTEGGLSLLKDVLGEASSGTPLECEFTGPSGASITLTPTDPITDLTGTVGEVDVSIPNGTVSGTTVTGTPDSNGHIAIDFTVGKLKPFVPSPSISRAPARQFSASLQVSGPGTAFSKFPTITGSCHAGLRIGFQRPASTFLLSPPPDIVPTDGQGLFGDLVPVGTVYGPSTSPLQSSPKTITVQQVRGFVDPGTGILQPYYDTIPQTANVSVVTNAAPFGHLTLAPSTPSLWLSAGALNSTTTPAFTNLVFNPNATQANASATLTFSSSDVPATVGTSVTTVNYKTDPVPWGIKWGFANAASYASNVAAPGEQFALYGYNFGTSQLTGPLLGSDGRAVTNLGGTQVMFDGKLAPLYYTVNQSGNAVVTGFVPFGIDGQSTTQVQVVYNGVIGPPITLPVVPAVLGLYTANASGFGPGAILNQNLTVNSPSNPAHPGDIVVLYGTGAGQTNPPGRDGALTGVGAPVPVLKTPPQVFIDGQLATNVPYVGPAPGLVEGTLQVNVQIPSSARSGELPVWLQVGNALSQSGVTVSVR